MPSTSLKRRMSSFCCLRKVGVLMCCVVPGGIIRTPGWLGHTKVVGEIRANWAGVMTRKRCP